VGNVFLAFDGIHHSHLDLMIGFTLVDELCIDHSGSVFSSVVNTVSRAIRLLYI
jgi:hypothetical protein